MLASATESGAVNGGDTGSQDKAVSSPSEGNSVETTHNGIPSRWYKAMRLPEDAGPQDKAVSSPSAARYSGITPARAKQFEEEARASMGAAAKKAEIIQLGREGHGDDAIARIVGCTRHHARVVLMEALASRAVGATDFIPLAWISTEANHPNVER